MLLEVMEVIEVLVVKPRQFPVLGRDGLIPILARLGSVHVHYPVVQADAAGITGRIRVHNPAHAGH